VPYRVPSTVFRRRAPVRIEAWRVALVLGALVLIVADLEVLAWILRS
jgi:hypothetical protein